MHLTTEVTEEDTESTEEYKNIFNHREHSEMEEYMQGLLNYSWRIRIQIIALLHLKSKIYNLIVVQLNMTLGASLNDLKKINLNFWQASHSFYHQ